MGDKKPAGRVTAHRDGTFTYRDPKTGRWTRGDLVPVKAYRAMSDMDKAKVRSSVRGENPAGRPSKPTGRGAAQVRIARDLDERLARYAAGEGCTKADALDRLLRQVL